MRIFTPLILGVLLLTCEQLAAQNDSLPHPRKRFEWDWKFTSIISVSGGAYTPLKSGRARFTDAMVSFESPALVPFSLRAEVFFSQHWGVALQAAYLTTGDWQAQFEENLQIRYPGTIVTPYYSDVYPAQRAAPQVLGGPMWVGQRGRWFASTALLGGLGGSPASGAQAEVKTPGTNELLTVRLSENSGTTGPFPLVMALSQRIGCHFGRHTGFFVGVQVERVRRTKRILFEQTAQHTGQSQEGNFWYKSPAWPLLGEAGLFWHFE